MSGTRGAAVRVSFLVLDAFPAPGGRRRSDPPPAPVHEAESGETAAAVAERERVRRDLRRRPEERDQARVVPGVEGPAGPPRAYVEPLEPHARVGGDDGLPAGGLLRGQRSALDRSESDGRPASRRAGTRQVIARVEARAAPGNRPVADSEARAGAAREVIANLRRALDGLRAHAAHEEPGPLDSIDVPAPVGGRASRREDGGEPALPGDRRTSRHQEYLRVPLT